jgi:hypothetical protein
MPGLSRNQKIIHASSNKTKKLCTGGNLHCGYSTAARSGLQNTPKARYRHLTCLSTKRYQLSSSNSVASKETRYSH